MIVVWVKVSRGIVPFSPIRIDSTNTSQPTNGEICMDKSDLLLSNPARQYYRYTSVPIEAASCEITVLNIRLLVPSSLWTDQAY
jgi:hypothetical protein